MILGIDSGGSKTVALLADASGQVIGRGEAGSSNAYSVGEGPARAALLTARAAAFTRAGRACQTVEVACLGLAGVDRPGEREQAEQWARSEDIARTVVVTNDVELVLAAGTPEQWGIALVAGTGSMAYGRSRDGRIARAGGWGYILGDEGSGYAAGLAALHAVARAADGRAQPTRLAERVVRAWALGQVQDLIPFVYSRDPTELRSTIAALAPLVAEEAAAGDPVARAIVQEAGEELAMAVFAVAGHLALSHSPIPCALAGSWLVHGKQVAEAVLHAGARHGLRLTPLEFVHEPAVGAIRLAQRALRE